MVYNLFSIQFLRPFSEADAKVKTTLLPCNFFFKKIQQSLNSLFSCASSFEGGCKGKYPLLPIQALLKKPASGHRKGNRNIFRTSFPAKPPLEQAAFPFSLPP
jgi:hypothetical protein